MTLVLYGIANCDTVKRARRWLDARGLAYRFHDYKKAGADPAKLREWVAAQGWERILNRGGTTFRKLPEADRDGLDADKAVRLMGANPSAIRRPVVEREGGGPLVGFDAAEWAVALSGEDASA